MPDPVPCSPRCDDTASDAVGLEERPAPPQWSGLFLEPDLPPAEE